MFSRPIAFLICTCSVLLFPVQDAFPWGAEGHAAVGISAMKLTDDRAIQQLNTILGSTDNNRMFELCNWPDQMRELPEWDWATPQHYVNLPRSANSYDAERDCPEGLCATEAIKKYAAELANERLSMERRKQAFGWLCHVVGDMHQPLHCGFGDDRGGNEVDIIVDGETMNLHSFWDSHQINTRAGSLSTLLEQIAPELEQNPGNQWNPSEVDQWTNESHDLAATLVYPDETVVSNAYKEQSWVLIQKRLPLAAMRLARLLNATLGEGEVVLDR